MLPETCYEYLIFPFMTIFLFYFWQIMKIVSYHEIIGKLLNCTKITFHIKSKFPGERDGVIKERYRIRPELNPFITILKDYMVISLSLGFTTYFKITFIHKVINAEDYFYFLIIILLALLAYNISNKFRIRLRWHIIIANIFMSITMLMILRSLDLTWSTFGMLSRNYELPFVISFIHATLIMLIYTLWYLRTSCK